ncbi:unnamed protein product, partial [Nesidiocoris tenuis]
SHQHLRHHHVNRRPKNLLHRSFQKTQLVAANLNHYSLKRSKDSMQNVSLSKFSCNSGFRQLQPELFQQLSSSS